MTRLSFSGEAHQSETSDRSPAPSNVQNLNASRRLQVVGLELLPSFGKHKTLDFGWSATT